MASSKLIGFHKGTSELHLLYSVLKEAQIYIFILRMMQFKKIAINMGNMRKEIK